MPNCPTCNRDLPDGHAVASCPHCGSLMSMDLGDGRLARITGMIQIGIIGAIVGLILALLLQFSPLYFLLPILGAGLGAYVGFGIASGAKGRSDPGSRRLPAQPHEFGHLGYL